MPTQQAEEKYIYLLIQLILGFDKPYLFSNTLEGVSVCVRTHALISFVWK